MNLLLCFSNGAGDGGAGSDGTGGDGGGGARWVPREPLTCTSVTSSVTP